ncbi:hypothetical protein [Nocardioides terrisoli]|uniref:hypothetical protein n=1 Tax=Nocardioides terrisoli TaxID=3388267 RepID=UPI00287B8172|nr:hypothetical protein [Nocardioides marmorisolisilvae]
MTAHRVREYVYTDQKGRPKLRKIRFDPKDFRMESWSEVGCAWVSGTSRQEGFKDKALYRLPEVLWALRAGAPTYLCEGEKDADAVTFALGSQGVGTSHWQGANKFTAEQAGWFSRGIGPVPVVVDVDNAGALSGLIRRRQLLNNGTSGRRITMLAPPRPFKDAADAITAGHTLDDFREVAVPLLYLVADRYIEERKQKRTESDWYGTDGRLLLPEGWGK